MPSAAAAAYNDDADGYSDSSTSTVGAPLPSALQWSQQQQQLRLQQQQRSFRAAAGGGGTAKDVQAVGVPPASTLMTLTSPFAGSPQKKAQHAKGAAGAAPSAAAAGAPPRTASVRYADDTAAAATAEEEEGRPSGGTRRTSHGGGATRGLAVGKASAGGAVTGAVGHPRVQLRDGGEDGGTGGGGGDGEPSPAAAAATPSARKHTSAMLASTPVHTSTRFRWGGGHPHFHLAPPIERHTRAGLY